MEKHKIQLVCSNTLPSRRMRSMSTNPIKHRVHSLHNGQHQLVAHERSHVHGHFTPKVDHSPLEFLHIGQLNGVNDSTAMTFVHQQEGVANGRRQRRLIGQIELRETGKVLMEECLRRSGLIVTPTATHQTAHVWTKCFAHTNRIL